MPRDTVPPKVSVQNPIVFFGGSYYNYSIMGPKTLIFLLRPLQYSISHKLQNPHCIAAPGLYLDPKGM